MSSSQDAASDDIEDENPLCVASTKPTDCNEKNKNANKQNDTFVTLSERDQGETSLIDETATFGCHQDTFYSHADDDSWTASCAQMCFDIDEAIWQEDALSKYGEDFEKEVFLKFSLDLPNTGDEKCCASFADTFSGRQVTPDDIEDEKHVRGAPTKLSNSNSNNIDIKENGSNQAICVEGQGEKASISDTATGWCLENKSDRDTAAKCFDIWDAISQEDGLISNHQEDWPTSLYQTNDMIVANTSICGWANADETAWSQSTNHRCQVAFKDMEVQIQSTELSKPNGNLKETILSASLCVNDKTEKALVAADTDTGWHRKDNSGVSIEFCRQINEVSMSKKGKVGDNDLPLSKRRGGNCTFPDCDSFARRGGVCARHGAKLPTCKFPAGCSNVAVNRNVCKQHGALITSRKMCSIPSCGEQARTGGTCAHHGSKKSKGGKNDLPLSKSKGGNCTFPDCDSFARRGGVCARHGAKLPTCAFPTGCSNVVVNRNVCKQHGALKTTRKKCSIPSCGKQARTGGTCARHGSATKKCSYNGCTNIVVKGGVCIRHGAKEGVTNIIKNK